MLLPIDIQHISNQTRWEDTRAFFVPFWSAAKSVEKYSFLYNRLKQQKKHVKQHFFSTEPCFYQAQFLGLQQRSGSLQACCTPFSGVLNIT